MVTRAMVFAPVPVLTVTVEDLDGKADIHLHAGSQGVWQARVLTALGVSTVLCGCFGGEAGPLVRQLITQEGIEVRAVERAGRNGAYVHDRRGGERIAVAHSAGDPLSRHDLDRLYNATLAEGLAADVCLLSGPALSGPADTPLVSPDTYRRLCHDLRANGTQVIVDLAGRPLEACLSAGVDLLKVSHEELINDGRAHSDDIGELVVAMRRLHGEGARTVVVSRADRPPLVLIDQRMYTVPLPRIQVVEPRGAGDSMTAGIAAGLARGVGIGDAMRLGVAAGALNVTRHGLGTVDARAAEQVAERVELHPLGAGAGGAIDAGGGAGAEGVAGVQSVAGATGTSGTAGGHGTHGTQGAQGAVGEEGASWSGPVRG